MEKETDHEAIFPKQFEGDPGVDIRLLEEMPSQEMLGTVGDLSDIGNISFGKTEVLFEEVLHQLELGRHDEVDCVYVVNAFYFVVDNYVAMTDVPPPQLKKIRRMQDFLEKIMKVTSEGGEGGLEGEEG